MGVRIETDLSALADSLDLAPVLQVTLGDALDDLVAQSSLAEIGPATRQILTDRLEKPPEGARKHSYEFDEGGFEQYNRWMLQLVMLREKAGTS